MKLFLTKQRTDMGTITEHRPLPLRLPSATVALIMRHTEEVNQNNAGYRYPILKGKGIRHCFGYEILPGFLFFIYHLENIEL